MKFQRLAIIVFIILSIPGYAQFVNINDNCKEAYRDILSLNFNGARNLTDNEKSANPGNLYVEYLENYMDFLSVFISEDEDLFDSIEIISGERYDRIEALDRSSPYRNYLLGNMNLQQAMLRLKFHEYFHAAIQINRAYRLLNNNDETFPGFVPDKITLGVLHIMIGVVPDKYHWLLRLINMEGSVKQGREELMMALHESDHDTAYAYLKDEVLFFLGFVELNIEPDRKQLDELSGQISLADSSNLLLSYLQINILMRTGRNDEALHQFKTINRMTGYYPFYYLDYLQGECLLRKLETQTAEVYYTYFLNRFRGKNYIKDAWRKMAWIALLDDDVAKYRYYMNKVTETGNDDIGQDRDAEREAERGIIPDLSLIKARLLFDGGYYHQADSVLSTMTSKGMTVEEQVEKTYRQARISDESGNNDAAKYFYKKTIEEGKRLTRYFAGNSALKLAEIYEKEGHVEKARYYYNLCLEIDFDEYGAGIHGKAKAGLKRLSD